MFISQLARGAALALPITDRRRIVYANIDLSTSRIPTGRGWRQLVLGTLLMLAAICVALALGSTLFGAVGEALFVGADGMLGAAAWGLPLVLACGGVSVARGRALGAFRAFGDLSMVCIMASLIDVAIGTGGGFVGALFGESAKDTLSFVGAFAVGVGLISLVLFERFGPRAAKRPTVVCEPRARSVAPTGPAAVSPYVKTPADGTVVDRVERHHVYRAPATSLLVARDIVAADDDDTTKEQAAHLVSTLATFDVTATLEAIVVGPTTITFEAALAAGTKLGRVVALESDLSLAMGAKVRVITSRLGRVGFEVTRDHRRPVDLRELIEDSPRRAGRADDSAFQATSTSTRR